MRLASVTSWQTPGFDMAGVAGSTRRMTRQTTPAWADVRLVGLYPGAGSSEQDSGIAEVMHSAYPGQHRQSRLAASYPPPVDIGADLVRVPSWNRSTGLQVGPQTATTTGQLPDVSAECWGMGFTPEAQGTPQPVDLSEHHS